MQTHPNKEALEACPIMDDAAIKFAAAIAQEVADGTSYNPESANHARVYQGAFNAARIAYTRHRPTSGEAEPVDQIKHAFSAGFDAGVKWTDNEFPADAIRRPVAMELYLCSLSDRNLVASPAPVAELCEAAREPHVFLDCDGVLADFDTYAEAYFGMNPRAYEARVGSAQFWQELEAKGDFYRNLPLMPDAMALFEGVKHLHPTILTGCPRGNWAQGQKVAWAAEHFPGVPIITCRSADKRDYAKPGDVLIDDWAQHRHRWIEMGGVFITHHCAGTSLAALWAHYPRLRASLDKVEGKG